MSRRGLLPGVNVRTLLPALRKTRSLAVKYDATAIDKRLKRLGFCRRDVRRKMYLLFRDGDDFCNNHR
jgi:hypothetical protein